MHHIITKQSNKAQIAFAGYLRSYDSPDSHPKSDSFKVFSKDMRKTVDGFYSYEKNGLTVKKNFLRKTSNPQLGNKYEYKKLL